MYRTLDAAAIVATAQRLRRRVGERFPQAGLCGVAQELEATALEAASRSAAIRRPNKGLRALSWVCGTALGAGVLWVMLGGGLDARARTLFELLQGVEAAANLTVLLGAAIFSIVSFETRLKRQKALDALNELRALAHVVDMHQLTKEPESTLASPTASSPRRRFTRFELGRYLDYCSEMFSILGKLAALYGQGNQDPVVLEAIDGIEDLTTGLSRKVWQKIAILDAGASA